MLRLIFGVSDAFSSRCSLDGALGSKTISFQLCLRWVMLSKHKSFPSLTGCLFRSAATRWHHRSPATFTCPRKQTTSVSNASRRIQTNGRLRKVSKAILGSNSRLDGSSQVSIEIHVYDITLSHRTFLPHRAHTFIHHASVRTPRYPLSLIFNGQAFRLLRRS